jgi:hypothetical protein
MLFFSDGKDRGRFTTWKFVAKKKAIKNIVVVTYGLSLSITEALYLANLVVTVITQPLMFASLMFAG